MKPEENLHVCIDQATDKDILLHSLYHSVTERADNMSTILHLLDTSQSARHALRAARIYRSMEPLKELGSADESLLATAAAVANKKWQIGRTLRIRFLGGSAFLHNKVIRYAQEWERYANLRFFFLETGPAEIRISFKTGGSLSLVGTDALLVTDQQQPTMNFGWLSEFTPESEFSRVILHEFGHAMGYIHEQNHPESPIPWDKDKVYEYYGLLGWSKEKTDRQVLKRAEIATTNFSAYDPLSIMHDPIPAGFLTDPNYKAKTNNYLSPTDIEFAKQNYPKAL